MSLARKKEERGDTTYSAIALEVVRHHAFRRVTHKIATGTLPTDAWVIIHQQDREDGLGENSLAQNQSRVRSKPWIDYDNIGVMNLTNL